jgi:dolichol-phosphate mannosyltransferase
MVYVLLPAYNEERDIGSLLERIRAALTDLNVTYQVLVVNDGSSDRTLEILHRLQKDLPLEVLDHGVNKGLGQAMLTGLRRAAALVKDDDVVITMDADNTHDPCLIGIMCHRLVQGADVVIASRYELGGQEVGLSRLRSFLSRGASTLLKLFFPIQGAKDFTCGYRAYRGSVLKHAFAVYGDHLVEEHGFTCMAEILIKMGAVDARVSEVPLVLRYDLKSSPSKMKVLRTILRYFVLIAKNLGGRPPHTPAPHKGWVR